ncbi:MAG: DNA translocase FtsK 4TM domain-containing protein [Parcubacteria group bacterium]|nr:DNA translocase FtsK 4TM domain-containing protein [Parcubacteria group bacterium]
MARKRKKYEEDAEEEVRIFFSMKEETRHWILSVASFAGAAFFLLAAFAQAGVAGNQMYEFLARILGIGYYLVPAVFLILGTALIRTQKTTLVWTSLIGAMLLFLSGLGLLALLRDAGGMLGAALNKPLLSFFDFYATLVILGAVLVIALLMIFDATPSFAWLSALGEYVRGMRGKRDDELSSGTTIDGILSEETGPSDAEAPEDTGAEPVSQNAISDRGEDAATPVLAGLNPFTRQSKRPPHTLLYANYAPPPLSLYEKDRGKPGVGDIKANANIIRRTLQNFGISVEMDEISVGPSVTRYALKPAQGIKLSRIVGLQNDLALALAAHPIRIEAPIPGRSLVGIEIPNTAKTTVGLATILAEDDFARAARPLTVSLGRNVTGKPHFGDLGKMPHLLIAGATGSGKSVAIHAIIASLLQRNSPENLRFIMIDPKRVELTLYKPIPHLLTPVITEAKKAILALKWAAKEMERRYDILETESVRDIESYHATVVEPAYEKERRRTRDAGDAEGKDVSLPERMPYIAVVMDELADIMSAYPRELEAAIVRLAQMSRAVGIHLILSTQRPSVNVITGLIKANIPTRMAFQVASQTDSRTILDMGGAEKLLGAGDMLYLSGEMSKPVRLQSAFVSEDEIKRIVKFIEKNTPNALADDFSFASAEENGASLLESMAANEDEDGDELYEEARETVAAARKASTTFLQRKLRVGYARAARLMDLLEERGVVGPADGARSREVLIGKDEGYGEPATPPDEYGSVPRDERRGSSEEDTERNADL